MPAIMSTRSLSALSILLLSLILSSLLPPVLAAPRNTRHKKGGKRSTKYFHEPGWTEELGHYDARFFKNEVPYEEHRVILRYLIHSYLSVSHSIGIETWLAHGTLLGWWWNGQIMPWDYDLDVQVSTATMYYLGKHYNRTEHEYHHVDDDSEALGAATTNPNPQMKTRRYMLDVNPHHIERTRGDGQNIIDARWIDLSNGMFIDITGLAERDPVKRPGIWSCKNFHHYKTRDLYPMRETMFEGVPALVPYNFDSILTQEYGERCLVTTQWLNHRWVPELKEWTKITEDNNTAQKPTS